MNGIWTEQQSLWQKILPSVWFIQVRGNCCKRTIYRNKSSEFIESLHFGCISKKNWKKNVMPMPLVLLYKALYIVMPMPKVLLYKALYYIVMPNAHPRKDFEPYSLVLNNLFWFFGHNVYIQKVWTHQVLKSITFVIIFLCLQNSIFIILIVMQ